MQVSRQKSQKLSPLSKMVDNLPHVLNLFNTKKKTGILPPMAMSQLQLWFLQQSSLLSAVRLEYHMAPNWDLQYCTSRYSIYRKFLDQ